jgi:hypothetical protein
VRYRGHLFYAHMHRVLASWPERLFHPTAWRVFARAFEQRSADAEPPVLQCQQIDAAREEVSTETLRSDLGQTEERSDRCQVLSRDQGDLTRSVAARVVAVAIDAMTGGEIR